MQSAGEGEEEVVESDLQAATVPEVDLPFLEDLPRWVKTTIESWVLHI